MVHQDIRPAANASDRSDIADEIKVQLVVQRGVDCVRRSAEEERVAVWWRTHDRLSAQIATCPAPILDEKWLAEPFREPLTDQTREDVCRAAGAKADDDAHRPRGRGLS